MMPLPKQEDTIGIPIKQENRDVNHLSPLPDRKTILVSGSKRGTRMPEDTSRERRCSGLDSFLEMEMRMRMKRKMMGTWCRAKSAVGIYRLQNQW